MWQQAAAAIGGSILDKGIDFGFGVASGAMYEKQVRELRRTAYQDMVHSMKAAGLNPVLAVGANPGNSAAYSIQTGQSDVAGDLKSVTSAKEAAAKTETEDQLREPRKLEVIWNQNRLMEEVANRHRENRHIEANTELAHALEAKALKEAGLLDVSAKEVAERTKALEAENVKRRQEADIYDGLEGAILRRIEAYTGAITGGRKAMGK